MQSSESRGPRRPYSKPAVTVLTERELLEAIGPAQGYGTSSMPLDNEWSRKG